MRQNEGIDLAKELGVIFGRQENATSGFQKHYYIQRNKEISVQEEADMRGIHIATLIGERRR